MNDAAQDWPQRFLAHLHSERRLSAHTSEAYAHDLGEFLKWAEQLGLDEWQQIDSQHLRAFAAAEHRRGIGPRSIQRRLSSLRTFFNYLIRESQLKINPALDVRAPKAAKRLPVTLDADQMARLLAFRTDAELDKRDKAIMELFYSSGLRLAELVGLNVRDLDLSDRTVRVLGKGNKDRLLPIGRFAIEALREWLQERSILPIQDAEAVFVSRQGRRLGSRAIQLRVEAWARKQSLGQHVHPHMFRHSFASHLLESSQDLRGVQELLGHANISTTQVYTHLDFQHLAKIYDAAHPRARRKKAASDA
ncbi:MAG: tyrosine recombinase XerC [Steroidobacteraceae bacterium]